MHTQPLTPAMDMSDRDGLWTMSAWGGTRATSSIREVLVWLAKEHATAEDLRLTSAGVLVEGQKQSKLVQDNSKLPILARRRYV
jgi:hypothetical protein